MTFEISILEGKKWAKLGKLPPNGRAHHHAFRKAMHGGRWITAARMGGDKGVFFRTQKHFVIFLNFLPQHSLSRFFTEGMGILLLIPLPVDPIVQIPHVDFLSQYEHHYKVCCQQLLNHHLRKPPKQTYLALCGAFPVRYVPVS